MKPIYYVTNEKPKSHNKGGSKQNYKELHSERFMNKYINLYSGLPTNEPRLQSKLIYIHHNLRKDNIPDVDNLSKPIIDAFTGVIYVDDKQIVRREVNRIELDELQFVTVDMSNMPLEIANDLDEFIVNQENHILLLAIDKISLKDIRIGEI